MADGNVVVTRARARLIAASVLLGGCAIAVVVYVRTMCRPGYVPQLDAPLWRGTDLAAPPPCPGCGHGECLRNCPPGTCGAIDDDEAARAALDPSWSGLTRDAARREQGLPVNSSGLAGAILGLAYATNEWDAWYWLAVAARRGADWQMQQQLWDAWQAEQRSNVIYLHTDRHPDDDDPARPGGLTP